MSIFRQPAIREILKKYPNLLRASRYISDELAASERVPGLVLDFDQAKVSRQMAEEISRKLTPAVGWKDERGTRYDYSAWYFTDEDMERLLLEVMAAGVSEGFRRARDQYGTPAIAKDLPE